MPIPPRLTSVYQRLGWVEKAFFPLLALYFLVLLWAPFGGWVSLLQVMLFGLGLWVAVRLLRIVARRLIWRVRDRLIITYLFIAVVPLSLLLTLCALAVLGLTTQLAVYLVTSELDRRIGSLQTIANTVAQADKSHRAEVMRNMAELVYQDRFPGMEMVLRTASGVQRYPEDSEMEPPPAGWNTIAGITTREDKFYAWTHETLPDGDFTAIAPLPNEFLANLVPNLGVVRFVRLNPTAPGERGIHVDGRSVNLERLRDPGSESTEHLPPAGNRFDIPLRWSALMPVESWNSPGVELQSMLVVRTRPSAVYAALFSRKSDLIQSSVWLFIVFVALAFVVVELIALAIGVSMTRTITQAVHHLYAGTRRVMLGEFGHRIEVKGDHQVAALSDSFNQMTSRLEELLVVAKEKERLQSELEIAREVQNQLYPKKVPDVRTLRLTAVCKPARMVSGDYFDYDCIQDSQVALAIGDVAGKGISAALLMATLQSSLRTDLRSNFELAAAAGSSGARGAASPGLSTAQLVSHLNQQLYAYTSPEKYATFYLGIYDEEASMLTYTNAGHLPPILVRDGESTRLNVDGTVVGAFPFSQYEESKILLRQGDLLVCFTDGVSEPENEYGEMFGEERLADLVTRNAHRSEDQIIETVIQAVEQWTGTAELQDDLTLLLIRRH